MLPSLLRRNRWTTMETQATGRSKRQTSHEFYKKLYKLTGAGGAAFWITDFVISVSPIAAEYRAAFSISYLPMALVEALVGGLIIGCCVSYFLLRFFDKIPTKNPILKALILSFVAMNERAKVSCSWNSCWLSIQKAVRVSLILVWRARPIQRR